MNIVGFIKSLYNTPSAESLALRELENSRRSLLEAQSAQEYSYSMCKYYEAKIKRLSEFLRVSK